MVAFATQPADPAPGCHPWPRERLGGRLGSGWSRELELPPCTRAGGSRGGVCCQAGSQGLVAPTPQGAWSPPTCSAVNQIGPSDAPGLLGVTGPPASPCPCRPTGGMAAEFPQGSPGPVSSGLLLQRELNPPVPPGTPRGALTTRGPQAAQPAAWGAEAWASAQLFPAPHPPHSSVLRQVPGTLCGPLCRWW